MDARKKIMNALEVPHANVSDVYDRIGKEERVITYLDAHKLERYHRRYQDYLHLRTQRKLGEVVDIDMAVIRKNPCYHKSHEVV